MNTNKILIGGLIGSVILFILGWLIYGMALNGFFAANAGTATGVDKETPDMLYLIIGHLAFGFLLALIYGRWAGIKTAQTGAIAGLVIGLLIGIGSDFITLGVTNVSTLTAAIVDILIVGFNMAVAGAAVGWWMGRE